MSKVNPENPKNIPDRYDLRPSDFTVVGSVISIREAFEIYKEEAIYNIEQEERIKFEEEQEKLRLEQAENQGEGEGDHDNQESHHSEQNSDLHKHNDDHKYMTENSFLDRLKEMKSGSPSPIKKSKKAPVRTPPEESSNSENSD